MKQQTKKIKAQFESTRQQEVSRYQEVIDSLQRDMTLVRGNADFVQQDIRRLFDSVFGTGDEVIFEQRE